MTIAFVQSASSTAISGATVTVTLGAGTTAGNCLVIASGVSQASANPTITGITLGGAADHMAQLVTVGTPLTTTAIAEIWADPSCAGGQTSVVVTYSVTPPNTACVFVYEFSGIATSSPLDQSSTAFTTSSQATFDSGATPTTTQASELWFGADSGFSTTTTGPSSPWINSAVITSGNRNLIAGYQIVSSTGTADYSGTYSPNSFENAAVVTLKPAVITPGQPAAPLPPLIPPHPLFTQALLEEAYQRADWQAQGVADLAVKFSSTSGGVDTYDVTSPYNGTGTHPMRVLAPTAPNPDYPHAFLLMLPVEQNQQTGTYGDSIGIAQSLAAHNGYNLTCVQPGYAGIGGANDGPWYADNPLNQAIWQETFTLLVTAWIRKNLGITGAEQVYLIGFSRSGLGGQNLLLRHPYTYAAVATWDTPYGMSDYDGTDPVRGSPVGGDTQDGYGTSANFTNHYQLTAGRLAGLQATGQYGINRIWIGAGPANPPDFSWYDGLLTTAGIPHTSTFSNTVEVHAWQPDWVAAGLQAIIGSNAPTVLPQQYVSHPIFTRLLEAAEYRLTTGTQPAAATAATAGLASGTGAAHGPAAAVAVNAGLASGTGTAQSPVAAIGVNAAFASGAGAAQNATASTSASGTANAAVATGTGTAQSPVAAIGVNAAAATGAGAALNATASTSSSGTANAVLASAAGTAQQPFTAIAVNAAAATAAGAAQGIGRAATAGLATGTAAAQAPTAVLAAQAQAQAAHALATALNASGAGVEPFTVARLTASDAPLSTLTASDGIGG